MRGLIGGLAGALIGGAAGFGAVILWDHLQARPDQARPAGGDPIANWAEGMTQLLAAICAAAVAGLIGAVSGAVLVGSGKPDRHD